LGEISVVQGDPAAGKTNLMLSIAAHISTGTPLPFSESEPIIGNVIYQNAEDGIEDTIKPRLENVCADCSRVAYLDGDGQSFSVRDDSIEKAVIRSSAKLLVLDPIQAFIGDVDMNRANDIRGIMSKLAGIAERTGCAIVLVGHMNKSGGGKGIYRGLGSIDFTAAARSVLLIGRVKDDPSVRAVVHIKSNLAAEGKPVAFELSEDGFRWIGEYNITQDELLGDTDRLEDGKLADAVKKITEIMSGDKCLAADCITLCAQEGIGERTVQRAKAALGLKSQKIQDKWYWMLPTDNGGKK